MNGITGTGLPRKNPTAAPFQLLGLNCTCGAKTGWPDKGGDTITCHECGRTYKVTQTGEGQSPEERARAATIATIATNSDISEKKPHLVAIVAEVAGPKKSFSIENNTRYSGNVDTAEAITLSSLAIQIEYILDGEHSKRALRDTAVKGLGHV